MGVVLAVTTALAPFVAPAVDVAVEAFALMVELVLQWVNCGTIPMTSAVATTKTAATLIVTPCPR
jgi:hypothetical protein